MQQFIREVADTGEPTYFVSPAHPRLVGGTPTKNPRYLQPRPDLLPQLVGRRGGEGFIHEQSLFFATLTAMFGAAEIGGHSPNAGIEPSRQRRMRPEIAGALCQFGEDRLADVFRPPAVAVAFSKRCPIHHVQVTADQVLKGEFGTLLRISGQQLIVGMHRRSISYVRRPSKSHNLLVSFPLLSDLYFATVFRASAPVS